MALLHIDHAINIPDKPAELEISSADWEKFMRSVWLRWWKSYYHQYQEEIDASLNDFTIRVFAAAASRVKEPDQPGSCGGNDRNASSSGSPAQNSNPVRDGDGI
jgi:hypothetical protein